MTPTRPRYTTEDIARFMSLARGGRDRRDDRAAAMKLHPAGSGLDAEDKGRRSVPTLGGEQQMTPTNTTERSAA